MTQLPSNFSEDLTVQRLRVVSDKLLDVLDEANDFAQSPNATPWFKGTANYGLPQGMLKLMHEDNDYPWLTLANNTMDYTVRIGNTLVQFVVDDPYSPRKSHRKQRNAVERNQLALALEEHDQNTPLIWRFYMNPISNGIDYSPQVTLVGYDINKNIVCTWTHDDVVTGPIGSPKVQAIEIEAPVLKRKVAEGKESSNE
ncbi:hypothetical protein [Pseudoalteromonas gelatinilytica]|uniref:Phage protein n=1 Tax=Pseudoalteromonas gelatinilytica TaxID=1703256 RepID=A0ABQ1UFL0_9GAMM|nr:hypothetical protein [Pseudoalteromonas profundi]GGF15614.1 hypothetical protein GCM10008027_45480 [Pseudoalteromonas profundi]